jgi:predicted Zn-dependent protease with MMP-like domain
MVWEFRRVLEIESEAPPMPHAMSRDDFAAFAEQALTDLPEELGEHLRDVAVVVEDRPSVALVEDGVDPRLLGLFDGLPYPDKSSGVARGPDSILLFQRNLEAFCRDAAEMKREIRTTVIHEAGHYFGMDEEELARRGLD